MALFKISDRYPDYRDRFLDGNDIKGLDVYTQANNEKAGSIRDVLIDEANRIRYFVVDTGFWVFGKQVLLPIGRCVEAPDHTRIYVTGLTKQQVEALPEYPADLNAIDRDYEERVRSVYRTGSAEVSAPVEMSVPVEQAGIKGYSVTQPPTDPASNPAAVEPPASIYEQTPELYTTSPENQRLRLYEERLVTDKQRHKAGDVVVSKQVETNQAEVVVPVQKEKVVISTRSGGETSSDRPVNQDFQAGEVARIDIYEEQADIQKEVFVREEVNLQKQVEQDTVTARETLRREELDVQTEGSPNVIDRQA
ncbi:DUF2382 domain-containing protein [Sphaerothrix gracilis]|uniref:DUF2382 domain-containing protein n=1 Tax=Sphaerothrix gracilis TaxID=3151835 RepID=UPI0031FE157B